MVDRVNWIWGHLAGLPGDKVQQLIAETGWASDGNWKDPQDISPRGPIVGAVADAETYYNTLKAANFKAGNATAMQFMAYDVPYKATTSSNEFSENHYGVFGWSNRAKFASSPDQSQYAPLLKKFAIITLAPTSGPQGVPYANAGQSATDRAYSYALSAGGSWLPGDIPWYMGSNVVFVRTRVLVGTVLWIPSPSWLIPEGTTLTLTTPKPRMTDPKQPAQAMVTFALVNGHPQIKVDPDLQASLYGNLVQAQYLPAGDAAHLYLAFSWLHSGADTPGQNSVPVYQDFWAVPSSVFAVAQAADSFQRKALGLTQLATDDFVSFSRSLGIYRIYLLIVHCTDLLDSLANAALRNTGLALQTREKLLATKKGTANLRAQLGLLLIDAFWSAGSARTINVRLGSLLMFVEKLQDPFDA